MKSGMEQPEAKPALAMNEPARWLAKLGVRKVAFRR